jgi:hypothetical protein
MTERVEEATLVAVRAKSSNPQLGAYLSKAMQDAIEACHAEGQFAPQIIRERMMAAYDAAAAEYDRLMTEPGGTP